MVEGPAWSVPVGWSSAKSQNMKRIQTLFTGEGHQMAVVNR